MVPSPLLPARSRLQEAASEAQRGCTWWSWSPRDAVAAFRKSSCRSHYLSPQAIPHYPGPSSSSGVLLAVFPRRKRCQEGRERVVETSILLESVRLLDSGGFEGGVFAPWSCLRRTLVLSAGVY